MSHDSNLLKYLRQSKHEGASEAEIRKTLLGAGWGGEDIDLAFGALDGGHGGRFLHLHLFHYHVPFWIAILVLVSSAGTAFLIPYLYLQETTRITEAVIPGGEVANTKFIYGSWPALQSAHFFETMKQSFISEKSSFIEADLSLMKLRMYKEGAIVKEVPILSKGKSGSWWETPVGLYKVHEKEKTHYSSFGHVYMPWSMQVQGNFFIHGWPYYENGESVPNGYSGGCIRLGTEDAKEIFALSKAGMPVLVFEKSFGESPDKEVFSYETKKPAVSAVSYLAADLENNFVFTENSSEEQRSIASITKLMTALVAVEYINIEHKITIEPVMLIKTSISRLKTDSQVSLLDLLSLLLMESSNEAARAVTAPLGESQFVNLMNNKAQAIGMKQTSFADTSGVLSGDLSTAKDLFMLTKYLYYNRSFVLHMSVGDENRAAYGPSDFKNLTNLNSIPGTEGMIGGKIGLSTSAGDSMLAVFEIEVSGKTRPIVIIALGSSDSKQDVKALLQYIQFNYAGTLKIEAKESAEF